MNEVFTSKETLMLHQSGSDTKKKLVSNEL